MKKIVKKIGANWLFLIAVAMVYLIVGLGNPQIVLAGLEVFLGLLKKMLPVLGIVFALLFLSNLFLNPKTVLKYLGTGAGSRGWPIAVAAGILSAGPIYMWYPLLGDLESKGYERCPDRHLSLQPGRKNPSSTHDDLLLRPQAGGDPDDLHDSVFGTERFAGRTIDSTEWRRTN